MLKPEGRIKNFRKATILLANESLEFPQFLLVVVSLSVKREWDKAVVLFKVGLGL